jgi:putative ABC transport system permease protein
MIPTKRRNYAFAESARMAFETLLANKTRSALTALGVFIAVVVLVMVFSIMYGVDADIRAQVEQYGTDTLFIYKFEPGIHIGRLPQELRTRKPLKYEDGEAIRDEAKTVRDVCVEIDPTNFDPAVQDFIAIARYRGKEVTAVAFEGATPSYQVVQNQHLVQGRFFTDAENLHRMDVVVIGYDLAETLFPAHDSLGKELQISGMTFHVIGVLEKTKGVFLRDNNPDKQVIVPYQTYMKYRPQDKENFITALALPGKKS